MKTIDIENQKKLLKTAKKILNCILEAKRRIEGNEENVRLWQDHFFYHKKYLLDNIDCLKRSIDRLEQRYAKIISQL